MVSFVTATTSSARSAIMAVWSEIAVAASVTVVAACDCSAAPSATPVTAAAICVDASADCCEADVTASAELESSTAWV